jgi:hypothetical protein
MSDIGASSRASDTSGPEFRTTIYFCEGAEHLRGPEVNHELEFGRLTALAIPRSTNLTKWRPFPITSVKRLRFCCAHHFRLDRIIEHNPCLVHLWSKRRTELLCRPHISASPNATKCDASIPKSAMLASCVAGLEHFTFIERTNNRRDCIHQLGGLSLSVVMMPLQTLGWGGCAS